MRNRKPAIAACAALIFASVCMTFSWVHMFHDGDSLLLSFISIDKWTPFYWADRRYGMPLPLLASWISDPVWNLLFQTQFFALSIVGMLLVGNAYFFHSETTGRSVRIASACIAFVLALVVLRPTYRTARAFLLADPYVISIFPMLCAVTLCFRVLRWRPSIRLVLAVPLIFVSLWINYSHVLLAVIFAVLLPHASGRWRETLRLRAAFIAVAAGIYGIVRSLALRFPTMAEPGFAPSQWSTTAARLYERTTGEVLYPAAAGALLLCAVTAAAVWRRSDKLRLGDGAVFGFCALLFALAVAISDWPMHNAYEPRYWTTPLVLLLLLVTAWTARVVYDVVERVCRSRDFAIWVCAVVAVAASLKIFGVPNPLRAREVLLSATGRAGGKAAVDLRCTHMVGDYTAAWRTVFYARATGHPMWAVVSRSEVTRHLWDVLPESSRLYCADQGDPNATVQSFRTFGLKMPVFLTSKEHIRAFNYDNKQ